LFLILRFQIIYAAVDRKVLDLLEEIKLNSQTTITLLQHLLSSREVDSLADTELGRRLPVSSVEELELVNSDAAHTDMRGRLVRANILHLISCNVLQTRSY
jgi:hypothetical protein